MSINCLASEGKGLLDEGGSQGTKREERKWRNGKQSGLYFLNSGENNQLLQLLWTKSILGKQMFGCKIFNISITHTAAPVQVYELPVRYKVMQWSNKSSVTYMFMLQK